MDAVNAAMNRLFDLAWAPFAGMPPWVGLFVLGVLFGIAALLAMKYCANQKAVEATKSRYQGHILAIKLFRDSFAVVVGSLVKTLGWIGVYLLHQFKPLLVMFIPFTLLFAQMQLRLAYRPFPVGEQVLVDVKLDGEKVAAKKAADLAVTVKLPDGVELAPGLLPVRSFQPATETEPATAHVVFPLVVKKAGRHALAFTCNGVTETKAITAGDGDDWPMLAQVRSSGLLDRVLYPAEPSFAAGSPFTAIQFAAPYPIRRLDFLGLDLNFGSELGLGLTFMVLTIVVALLLKDLFGVTI